MSETIPPMSPCSTECEETVVTNKCYTIREAIPACAATTPAGTIEPDGCTRIDKTYDQLLSSSVVPLVGNVTTLSVCNASLYSNGQWIQFVDGSAIGAIFQVVSINTVENLITVRNACADGVTQIDTNPSPGQTIETSSRFGVIGEPVCANNDQFDVKVAESVARQTELCLDNIENRASSQEAANLVGTIFESDCEEGDARPCLRKLYTREKKDGSLRLANLNPEAISGLRPLYANDDMVIVSGGSTGSSNYGISICGGQVKVVKNAKFFVPFFNTLISKSSPDIDNQSVWEEEVDLTSDLAGADIETCSESLGAISIRASVHMARSTSGSDTGPITLYANGKVICQLTVGEGSDSNISSDAGSIIIPLPVDNKVTFKLEVGGGGAWSNVYSLLIESQGVFA